jgi:hypothetical protein
MKRAFVLGAILLASLRVANAADVSGTWHVTGSVSDNPVDATCTFTEKDAALTGTCVRKDKGTVDATGSVKGQTIEWHYNSEYNGDAITITYSGTLGKDGGISGTIVVDPYRATGEFTATKK